MIFLSYNHLDSEIIDTIAQKLLPVFDQKNIFYDKWTIQPGDGIIDFMNQGLGKSSFFFFFASKNSLSENKKMVTLEWQNAIIKALKSEIKFIPVKLDDCFMPAILLQNLYIDIFGKGFEVGLKQIIDVCQGRNTYQPGPQTYQNVRGYVTQNPDYMIIEFRAETYLEPISRYLILAGNKKEEIKPECLSDSMFYQGFNNDTSLTIDSGLKTNSISVGIDRGTTPGFPFIIKLSKTGNNPIVFNGLMRAVESNRYQSIPVIYK